MERNRSKAFIITFIIVLLILIVGYLVLVRRGIVKDNTIIGKKFAPVLTTPKQKDVITDDTGKVPAPNDDTPTTPPTDDTTTEPGTNGPVPGTGTPEMPKYVPPLLPLPKPDMSRYDPAKYKYVTECSDGKDNDKDGVIDSADDDCHFDNNAKNPRSYVATYTREAGSKNVNPTINPTDPTGKKTISCDIEEVPLVFTAEEQAQLDELTREFYRLAPQLKTENDIIAEISSKQGYDDIITNAKELTKQCWDYTTTPQYLRNDINSEVIGQQKVQVFSKEEQEFLEKYGAYGNNATLSGKTPDDIRSGAWVEVDIINSSTLDKGRTERRATKYYNPLAEYLKNPVGYTKGGSTSSYYKAYFINPLTGLPEYSWKDWEEIRGIAYSDKGNINKTASSTQVLTSNFVLASNTNIAQCKVSLNAQNTSLGNIVSYAWEVNLASIQAGYSNGVFNSPGKFITNTKNLSYEIRTDKQIAPVEYATIRLTVKDASGKEETSEQKLPITKSQINCL